MNELLPMSSFPLLVEGNHNPAKNLRSAAAVPEIERRRCDVFHKIRKLADGRG
jgi:hypothetical protein